MLDWTEGATWFTTGLGTTLALTLFLGVILYFASRAAHR
jgi:hypothetical protein